MGIIRGLGRRVRGSRGLGKFWAGMGGRSASPMPTLGPVKLGRRWGTELVDGGRGLGFECLVELDLLDFGGEVLAGGFDLGLKGGLLPLEVEDLVFDVT